MKTEVKSKKRWWPKSKRWRITLILTMTMLFVVTGALGFGYWMLHKSLPTIEGEVVMQGLQSEVSVVRDENGVPHIHAENNQDLFMAQGYVTAQDRMFQMDMSRRQASGKLSEVIGEQTIDRDRYFRTLGLRRAAEASYAIYSEEAKQVMEWYTMGVNAYIQEAKENNTLPIEFTVLGYEPEEWTIVDSLTIGKFMAYDLGGNWKGQAFRYYLVNAFDEEKAMDLFPTYPADAETIMIAKQNAIDLNHSVTSAIFPNEWNGSNNWVISGSKTESGFPILANDPHLGVSTPAIWYETHLKSPELEVKGVIFAGVPGIILGHNAHVAWGVTNVGPDVQDLYIEKRNPDNPYEVEYMGKWEKLDTIEETIEVKDQPAVEMEVNISRHGPLVSEFMEHKSEENALALRWTALDPTTELEAILLFAKATNWDEFKYALTFFHAPAQNFVFADKSGTIAYRANGKIPIRENGDSLLPVAGWTDEYEWKDYIPWDELPTVVNPEEGFIATANNKVIDDGYDYHIANLWAEPYRFHRITEVLRSKDTLSVEDSQKLQLDSMNLQAKEFLPPLLSMLQSDSAVQWDEKQLEAISILQDWNFEDNKELSAPFIYHLWRKHIGEVIFKDAFEEDMYDLFQGKHAVEDQLIRNAINNEPGPWIQEKGGLTTIAQTAFLAAIDEAIELQGASVSKWQWGDFHMALFSHPLSSVKPLHLIFNPAAQAFDGSKVTVAAARNNENGEVVHGGVWRTVIDMENPRESFNVIGPGQSGHVLSDWYDNQVNDWITGEYHVTSMEESEYTKGGHMLLLKPTK
ncbi:penicillin acylase family protein [Longirhabdus pacifica]|uniref:penicillin acylase family protein n=1 Tax=Longirhabdus pacifica TaxID=2305227 RepID=UPI001008CA6A|nr:penicillin acylase family protein [Longirhabdus pacifica]